MPKGNTRSAGFDASLDVKVFSKEVEVGKSKIVLDVCSYNNGAKKLQFSRLNESKEDGSWVFAKLGRISKDEVKAIHAALPEIYKNM